MTSKLVLQKFAREQFQDYKDWFEDETLRNTLGDVDEQWLDHILQDESGIEFAVLQNDALVGVIGLLYPTEQDPVYAITNIAIHPRLKNRGLGSKMLTQLLQQYPLENDQYWISYVCKENRNAQRFFEKNGWVKNLESDMIKYVLTIDT